MDKPNPLPDRGPLSKPESPGDARELLKVEAFPAPHVQRITMTATEFTSLCPRSNQPDFGSIVIEYTPRERCLESKALKVYLWSYRDEQAFCETLAAQIADDIVYAIEPASVRVEVHQNVRGGIGIVAAAERSEE
jgi:7-cyano-7-deazaguanine reductase